MQNLLNLPWDEKKSTIESLVATHPDKVPVIFRISPECSFENKITKRSMLIEKKSRLVDVIRSFRKMFNLTSESVITFSANDVMLPNNSLVEELYRLHQSDDMILYLKIHELSPLG